MLPSDMNDQERREYPQGRCGRCGAGIHSAGEWEGDDYGWGLLCRRCGADVKRKLATTAEGAHDDQA